MLLLTQLVLFRVEALVCRVHWVAGRHSVHGAHVLVIHLLLIFLFLLTRFVSWELSQEFPGAGHRWVHLVVFGRNEKASEALQHDDTLLHVLIATFSLLLRQEEVKDVNRVIQGALRQPQVLRDLAQPVHDETAHFTVLGRYLEMLFILRLLELAL